MVQLLGSVLPGWAHQRLADSPACAVSAFAAVLPPPGPRLRRSILADSAERFAEPLAVTAGTAFRSATDLAPVTLASHLAHATGRAVTGELEHGYFCVDSGDDLGRLRDLADRRWADTFCLADGVRDAIPRAEQDRAVRAFLRDCFPVPSPFEDPAAGDLGPAGPGPGPGPVSPCGTPAPDGRPDVLAF
ncbi:stealth conserved region 3 domain-containing protein [Kitasatospora sp. NPDC048540]|uniref:stealth conserved region 3 domain-containing protein n=1 Tax=Kitasatospora sp. NPDC048540 TaxID=3155634 RepID=UPI0033F00FE9